MANVTIIGGHGKVALLAEPLLVERGHAVNALIRRPEQSEDIVTRGANPVVTDITALSTEEMAKLLTELGTDGEALQGFTYRSAGVVRGCGRCRWPRTHLCD